MNDGADRMTAADGAQLRGEPRQIHLEPSIRDRKSPMFDFGLFLLLYMFALVLVVTAMLAAGFTVQKYTCVYAIPLAWLGLAWFRKAPLYALLVTAMGVLFLAGVSLIVSQVFDVAWDSNCYHKADTGMLAFGWNPFKQTMISYANTTKILPYNAGWLAYQVDNQPKASFIIGASFYAFWGNIASGKVFNIASMVACICLVAPMLKDAMKVSALAAFMSILLVSANVVTIAQALTYYNDGFVYQMLTIAAAALTYMAFKPEGRYVRMAQLAAFLAVCMAINIKTSAVLFCAIICLFYYIARVIAIAQSTAEPQVRKRQQRNLFLYFVAMVLCAVCVLGATTYIVNLVRFGIPFYGMLGQTSINTLLESLMSPKIHNLPLFLQFFVSLFSPMANILFTDINLKVPFTVSADEWNVSALDTNINGWGILFSGIFILSLIVILRAIYLLGKRRSRKVKFLVFILITVLLPVFFIPYLFSARYYLQPYWIVLAALLCLFAPPAEEGVRVRPLREVNKIPTRLLGILLCGLLIVNCVTAYRYLDFQINETKTSRATMETIRNETENNGKVMDVTTASPGMFYALFFNLKDEGITKYNFTEHITDIHGTVLYYLAYNLRDGGEPAKMESSSFLYSLNSNGYIVVIAKQGASGALTEKMLAFLDVMALQADGHDSKTDNYLAVIDTNAHIRIEKSGPDALHETVQADGLPVEVQSSMDGASIVIDGTEYAVSRDGYNIVVYDPENMALVDSVVINTDATPILQR
jgi:hypothetical protein